MKKLLFIILSLVISIFAYANISEPIINYSTDYQITNVITYDSISADNLFNEARLILSKITGDGKSESIIDYSSLETKTIVIKTKQYIGQGKNRPLTNYHWEVFLNIITTIKIKDNKLQVKSNFTDFYFLWNVGNNDSFTLPFYECYPEWKMNDKQKKKYYNVNNYASWESGYEKAIKPNTETVITAYQLNICKLLDNICVNVDF